MQREKTHQKTPMAAPAYTLGEEITNAVSHGVTAAGAAAGTVLLILKSIPDPWRIVSSSIYGASMLLLFTMSCLYHAISAPRGKRVMRVFDHISIFLLIGGTYTPVTLVTLRGVVGWVLFGIVWGACLLGIVLNAVSIERFKRFSMLCYIAAGWSVAAAAMPTVRAMAPGGLTLLLAGGIAYTAGIPFYKMKHRRYFHCIWHFFVTAGAVLQFFAVYFYII